MPDAPPPFAGLTATPEAVAVATLAREGMEPRLVTRGDLISFGSPYGTVLDLETYAEQPNRKRGHATFYDAASFSTYVETHNEDGFIYADVQGRRLVALLNDHAAEGPGWGDHRATLALRHTPAWTRWVSRSGTIGSQQEFAEHIEESVTELVNPTGAEMLELAQSFHATTKVAFRSDKRLQSGQVQVQYEESIDAKAGQRGDLTIPSVFELGLKPFEGSDAFRVTARLRYRINDGQLRIGYKLERVDEVLETAFGEVVSTVADLLEASILRGTPRS